MPIPVAGYDYEADALADGVLHYYPMFDYGTEGIIQDVIQGESLAVYNDSEDTTRIAGMFGTCRDLTFNGTLLKQASLYHPGNASATDILYDWTIGIWFDPDTLVTANNPTLLKTDQTQGFNVYFDYPGSVDTLYITWTNGSISTMSTTTMPTIGQKNLLLITSNSTTGTVEVYLNNVLVGTDAGGYQELYFYISQWLVGCDQASNVSTKGFDGQVDEMFVIDHDVDATDRATLWNTGSGMELVKYANAHRVLVNDTIGLNAVTFAGLHFAVAETLGLSATATSKLKASAIGSDQLGLGDTLAVQKRVQLVVLDELGLSDVVTVISRLNAVADDTVSFITAISEAGDSYAGISVNTGRLAVSEYSDYNFNSLVKTGTNEFMGATASGIYRIEGNQDDGAAIKSLITTKNFDFGNDFLKRVERVYLVLNNDGPIALKVLARDEVTDTLVENWYGVTETSDINRTIRVKIGKGIKAHFYQFTLESNGGSNIDLTSVEFKEIKLSRRL